MTPEYKPNPGWAQVPSGAENFIVCARLHDGSFRGGYRVIDLRWTIEGKPDDIIEYAVVRRSLNSVAPPARRVDKKRR